MEVEQRRRELEEVEGAFTRINQILANIATILGAAHPLAMAIYALIVATQRHKKKIVKELKTLS